MVPLVCFAPTIGRSKRTELLFRLCFVTRKVAKVSTITAVVFLVAAGAGYVLQAQAMFEPGFLGAYGFHLEYRVVNPPCTPGIYRDYTAKIRYDRMVDAAIEEMTRRGYSAERVPTGVVFTRANRVKGALMKNCRYTGGGLDDAPGWTALWINDDDRFWNRLAERLNYETP